MKKILLFVVLLTFAGIAYGQDVPDPGQGEKAGCVDSDGTFHKCGESWTQIYDGVVYDCTCHCPENGPDCVPRVQENVPATSTVPEPDPSTAAASADTQPLDNEQAIDRQRLFEEGKAELLDIIDEVAGELEMTSGIDVVFGPKSPAPVPEVLQEQKELDQNRTAWQENHIERVQQRLQVPNKWCRALAESLTTKAPPLPYKNFSELQPGDVLLIGGKGIITAIDNALSGDEVSYASHTVSYLKEVNGKKLFLDNQPLEGPRIISENEFLEKYASRGAEVARLVGQPLNSEEAKHLFSAAVKMAQNNRQGIAKNWFGITWLTNYGVWGDDDVVCSESDWVLINAAGRKVPKSFDQTKLKLDIDFSPADYRNGQYFLVTRLAMP